jgi:hypothetical protein
MISLKSLAIEYKTGVVMGVAALVLSFLTGLITGNDILYCLGRAFFFGILFAFLGFGGLMLLKKFVPEAYAAVAESDFSSAKTVDTSDNVEVVASGVESAGEVAASADAAKGSKASDESVEDGSGGPEFEPLGDYYKKQPGPDHLDVTSSKKSMGRHVLLEKNLKYEPKILAAAVRTMMSRDK